MKVIFACAGTGGHINPAIAIAGIILKNKPDTEVLFIGTKTGLENELVKKSGFEIVTVSDLIYQSDYYIDNTGKQIKK